MSGIAGIFYRNGRPTQPGSARTMIAAMPHRCRGGLGEISAGPVALAHGTMFEIPGEATTHQPTWHKHCLITADARLDNKDEIVGEIGLKGRGSIEIPEDEIIVRSYLKWGENCVERFVGDFAFALWDRNRHELFCARDHLGSKSFCYHASDRIFAFGTEPKALLTLPDVSDAYNEEYLCYHFFPDLMVNDEQITNYAEIKRLEPAHKISVSKTHLSKTRYWSLDPHYQSDLTDEADYISAFREKFTNAVSDRLRSPYRVGSTLSGGLDSSSIACVARDTLVRKGALLKTYSAVFDEVPSADEREWIDAVVSEGEIDNRRVHPDSESALIDIDTLLWLHDGPFYGANYFIHWHIYRAASMDGVGVLLDGEDGDTTVSHGVDFLLQLLQRGKWGQFVRESDAVVQNFDNERTYASRNGMCAGYALPYLHSLFDDRRWLDYLTGARAINRSYQVPMRTLLINHGVGRVRNVARLRRVISRLRPTRRSTTRIAPPDTMLKAELVEKYRLRERTAEAYRTTVEPRFPSHPRYHHHAMLSSGALAHGLELFERMAAFWGIELRHPFCDRRLVEFCLSVPPELKLRRGLSRYIFRESLRGTMPERVRLRGGKGDLSDVSLHGLRKYDESFLTEESRRVGSAAGWFIDSERTQSTTESFLQGKSDSDMMETWQAATLTRWFDSDRNKQAVRPDARDGLIVPDVHIERSTLDDTE